MIIVYGSVTKNKQVQDKPKDLKNIYCETDFLKVGFKHKKYLYLVRFSTCELRN